MLKAISEQAKIGINVSIKRNVVIEPECVIEDGARIYEGCIISKGSVIAPNVVLRPNTKIGRHCIIGTSSVSDGDNEIGDYCTVGALSLVARYMSIGKNCFIGPGTIITNTRQITSGRHGKKPSHESEWVKTIIEDDVRIGACCKIFPGVRIGKSAIVDMGVEVRRDVPARTRLSAINYLQLYRGKTCK